MDRIESLGLLPFVNDQYGIGERSLDPRAQTLGVLETSRVSKKDWQPRDPSPAGTASPQLNLSYYGSVATIVCSADTMSPASL